jgi:hypothetical protein
VPSLIESLRAANRRLSFQLDSISARQETRPWVMSPETMATLLSDLLSAGAGLRAQPLPPRGNDQDLDRELDEYRRHVERLRDLLPCIHRALSMERARIEVRRSRLMAVAEWARASRQTL